MPLSVTRLVVGLAFAVAIAACAPSFRIASYPTSDSLFTAALAEYQRERWDNAIEGFEQLTIQLGARDSLLPASYYYLGMAHRRRGEELLAAQSFVRLVEAFPGDTLADDALFEAARSYQRLWRKPELDPQYGTAAIETFETLLNAYPQSPLVPRAQQGISALVEMLAQKDLRTAEQYLRIRAYDSAIIYLSDVRERYPETDTARRAGLYLVDVYRRLNYREEAEETCAQLRQRHPTDREVREACGAAPAPAALPAG